MIKNLSIEPKVGLNTMTLERTLTGVGVYIKHLVDGLISFDRDIELYSYASLSNYTNYKKYLKSEGIGKTKNILKKLIWNQWGINRLISSETNVFHSPSFTLPLILKKDIKYIVTVHDFAFLKLPHFYDKRTLIYLRLFIKYSLSKADRIICVSKSCQNDLKEFFPKYFSKSVVVYNGYQDYSKINPDIFILKRLNLKSNRFFMTIGNMHPRKNIRNMIKVFNRVKDKYPDYKFVIVGINEDKINNDYEFEASADNIVFPGYINDEELAALYQNCFLFMFMSYYEGFGFPILEAMSCKKPVITCSNSSLPEISGYKSLFLFKPDDVLPPAKFIIDLIEKDDLYYEFAEHAANQVQKFSWNKMVADTYTQYEEVLL